MISARVEDKRPAASPYPVPIPWIIAKTWGWMAILAVLAFPMAFALGAVAGKTAMWLLPACERCWKAVTQAAALFGLAIPFWAGLIPAGSRTSTFILECVRWYLDHGEEDKAKGLARALDYQVWYREWRRNPWFRRFAAESGLLEESARYAKFARRLPPG